MSIPPAVESQDQKTLLRRFIDHPAVLAVSLIANFVGILLSIYFYVASKEARRLAVYINPVKTTVVRAGQVSRLAATFDGKRIETDITAAQIAIWNAGGLAIRQQNVLKPLLIALPTGIPILEATVKKSTRDVTKLALDQKDLDRGRLLVSWEILESGDGAIIQLIYAGGPDAKIEVEGIVEGQENVEKFEFSGRIKSPAEQYESEKSAYRYPAYLVMVLGGLIIGGGIGAAIGVKEASKANADKYQAIHAELLSFFDSRIAFENDAIARNDKFVADVEEHIREQAEQHPGIDLRDVEQSQRQEINGYRREQEASQTRIAEFAEQKEVERKRGQQALETMRQAERRSRLTATAVALFGALCVMGAAFWLFLARPVQPPFGF